MCFYFFVSTEKDFNDRIGFATDAVAAAGFFVFSCSLLARAGEVFCMCDSKKKKKKKRKNRKIREIIVALLRVFVIT